MKLLEKSGKKNIFLNIPLIYKYENHDISTIPNIVYEEMVE